jgi:DNA-binding MarR family transcriptional regulator
MTSERDRRPASERDRRPVTGPDLRPDTDPDPRPRASEQARRERTRLAVGAWAALLHVHAEVVPRLDRMLIQTTGLPLSWYDVLLELAATQDGRLRMGELAERVVLSRTRVSRIVDELAAAGLVRRESDPEDGRSAFAVLTADGLAKYHAAAPVYVAGIGREFAGSLSDAELAAVGAMLRKVVNPPMTLARRSPAQPVKQG